MQRFAKSFQDFLSRFNFFPLFFCFFVLLFSSEAEKIEAITYSVCVMQFSILNPAYIWSFKRVEVLSQVPSYLMNTDRHKMQLRRLESRVEMVDLRRDRIRGHGSASAVGFALHACSLRLTKCSSTKKKKRKKVNRF